MSNSNSTPLLSMFPCLEGLSEMGGGLSKATVYQVTIDRAEGEMTVEAEFSRRLLSLEVQIAEDPLAIEYVFFSVVLNQAHP